MFARGLETLEPSTRLVQPVVSRDAPLSVRWLTGDQGRETLRMMGVPEELIVPAALDREVARIASFLERQDQYNWMMEFEGNVVGSIWVELRPIPVLAAPAVSYMVGATAARRKGVARASLDAVAQFIFQEGFACLYARALVVNYKSAALLSRAGFDRLNESYVDPDDRLHWQNFVLRSAADREAPG
jgi:RimJ/RimL family protein N-acetyltransferase